MQEKVLIVDFGSQYTQLIARRVRELFIFCEIYPFNSIPENLKEYKAVILSGSPFSVRSENYLKIDLSKIKGEIPLLGVCYGAQFLAHFYGGEVTSSNKREYGRANLVDINFSDPFFNDISNKSQVWMSHSDTIKILPSNGILIASTEDVKNAAFKIDNELTYGIQFHPEVYHSSEGKKILENFLVKISGLKQDWTPDSFVEMTIKKLENEILSEKVILGLSGGVDSSVASVLLDKAIGSNLICIFVNNGLLRKNEYEEVLAQYKGMGLNVKGVNASKKFIDSLKNVEDPEEKRKIIGKVFIDVFNEVSKDIEGVKWLAQGTIYPDVIESSESESKEARIIKSHHNVGGLPDEMKMTLVEPLRDLFKDEVRKMGALLGLPNEILNRHPFPGPGLGVRILGEINKENISILQEADSIFIEELKKANLDDEVSQAFCVYLPVKSVGVVGDERRYADVIALRAVKTVDFMTAEWSKLPFDFLAKVSNRIVNELEEVSRVVYDISGKPPATIEWE